MIHFKQLWFASDYLKYKLLIAPTLLVILTTLLATAFSYRFSPRQFFLHATGNEAMIYPVSLDMGALKPESKRYGTIEILNPGFRDIRIIGYSGT